MVTTVDGEPLPHPAWRIPVLGDLLTLRPAKPTQMSARDARALGPIFERRIVGFPLVVVSGMDLINEVNDEALWTKHVGVLFKKLRPISRDGLFTAYNHEPNWQKAHNILAPAFTRRAMQGYHATMYEVAEELIDKWDESVGDWVDIPGDMNRYTLEVIGRTGFGYTFESFAAGGDDHPFVTAMVRGLAYINTNSNMPPLVQRTLGRRAAGQHKKDVAYVKKVVENVITARQAEPDDRQYTDLLQRMLTVPDPDTGIRLDIENVRNQILTFLVSGHETSAGLLSFALHYLAMHPAVAEEARNELDRHGVGGASDPVTYEDVARLRYLRRIVDETLRLWPIAPGYFREATDDTTIGGRYSFRKGEWVFVLTLHAHRDPVWGNPDEFDPDRFTAERLRALPGPHVYKPFGTGIRACIARQFAYHEVVLALALLLRRYDFEADPNYRLEENIQEQITLKPAGLRLRVRRR